MPHCRPEDIPSAKDRWDFVGDDYRTVHWGDMEVGLTIVPEPLDCTQLYKMGRLPGGVCPCPHYGYMFEGTMRVIYPDSDLPDEVIKGGETFYVPAGHVLKYEEPSKVLELNPAAALKECIDGMGRAFAAGAPLPGDGSEKD
ncbi:hypothetical protein [Novosphingobium pentaromativorans]|uniref:Cupin 2 conserved barrel domain-containing protein n=1 Tax=Novosphingobium pentaromativorans US6-1 TaxID=1088721 RepID=G6ED49_9SPHN|nr:hypothetical protein [Novosphingobium pentaromativorans]EHJ60761.1 hypothetical protein NSU_2270 [Novosphingobium pentaromativorans US6-1]